MSRLRTIAFVALAALIALAVLLWRLPASSLLVVVPASAMAQTSKFVSLHGVEGTLWRGSARFTVALVPASFQLAWHCAPAITALAIDCDLSGALVGRLRVQPSAGRAQFENGSSQFALDFAANPTVLVRSERVALNVARMAVSRSQRLLEGGIVARDVTYRVGETTVALGEVFVDCKPAADNASSACSIKNRASAATLDGTVTLTPARATGAVELTAPGTATQRISF